jgi:hypothetical protein
MADTTKVSLTFADGSLSSNIARIPGYSADVNKMAAVQVNLHADFPTATAVELRFTEADGTTPAARYDSTGTLISFAGAASRQVALDPTDYCCVLGYVQLVSNTTIATGGICTVRLREV